MLFSAFASLKQNTDGVAMMKHIGYPYSVLTLLSIAKILGVIAILVPGFPRLKEWAYQPITPRFPRSYFCFWLLYFLS
jgi:hypothetical protein